VRDFETNKKGRTLTPTSQILVLIILAMGTAATALAQDASTKDSSPVADIRNGRSWEYAPFVNYGNGVGGDRSNYHFLSLGVEAGKVLTPVVHAGFLSGQFQYAVNIMPLWQAYTPAPHNQIFVYKGVTYDLPVGGGTYTGFSVTPVIFRWNFLTHSRRVQPWFQGAGGLIYTTHKFPPDVLVPHGDPGGTSVWNFSPQGGIGIHYFTREKRSVDLGLNAVHISSASLGDHNPGVNASLQFQLGYTFWK
jgi:lipid A 3-O-deacylase